MSKMEEKMVREFKLINQKGQKFSLMDIKKYCLLTDPSRPGLFLYNRVPATRKYIYK